jgi:hypothetical protein
MQRLFPIMSKIHIPTLPLLNGFITKKEASASDRDILQDLSYPASRFDFWLFLHTHRREIEEVGSLSNNIQDIELTVLGTTSWRQGTWASRRAHVHLAKSKSGSMVASMLASPFESVTTASHVASLSAFLSHTRWASCTAQGMLKKSCGVKQLPTSGLKATVPLYSYSSPLCLWSSKGTICTTNR